MSNEEITQVRKEVSDLRAELAQMRTDVMEFNRVMMADSELTTKHILGQDREIIDIFSYLMPLVRRAYPGIDISARQLRDIQKNGAPPDGKSSGTEDSG